MPNKTNKKGFTLIEIVIVLAIAALIMVVVFLAVQGAQRSQRNQQRKDFTARSLAKFQEYVGNHNGTAPDSGQLDGTFSGGERGNIAGTNFTATVGGAPTCTAGTTVSIVSAGPPAIGYICLEGATGGTVYQTGS